MALMLKSSGVQPTILRACVCLLLLLLLFLFGLMYFVLALFVLFWRSLLGFFEWITPPHTHTHTHVKNYHHHPF